MTREKALKILMEEQKSLNAFRSKQKTKLLESTFKALPSFIVLRHNQLNYHHLSVINEFLDSEEALENTELK